MRVPRAEHIGSFQRPDALLHARAAYDVGKCSADELRAREDAAIAAIVRFQLDLGLPVITDGEFRRCAFSLASCRPERLIVSAGWAALPARVSVQSHIPRGCV